MASPSPSPSASASATVRTAETAAVGPDAGGAHAGGAHAGGAHAGGAARDAGLLVLRLALGLTVAAHGSQKLFGWFGGGGIEGTGQFFGMSGYPAPEAMAVLAGLTETLGGLALALGLLTPLAGAAVTGTMINAVAVAWSGSFFAPEGVEYELLLAAAAAALTLTGPGRYALDALVPVLRGIGSSPRALALLLGVVAAAVLLLVRS